MNIQFITTEVVRPATAGELPEAIAMALQVWGEPLRWAITAVLPEQQTVIVEAIVMLPDGPGVLPENS